MPRGRHGVQVATRSTESQPLNAALPRADFGLATILDGIVDGLYALDGNWRFVLFNRGAEAHFGMSRDEVLGRSVWELFPQAVGGEFEQRFRAVRDSGTPMEFVTRSVVVPDTFMEFRVFPLEGGLGVSMRNLSEARRAEAVLRLLLGSRDT